MLKKHSILFAIIISILLLIIATLFYPGGSLFDKNAIGFSWKHNFISNLFADKAVNGQPNAGRFWAVASMIFLSVGFALFFVDFSKKIAIKSAANVIKYFGVAGMIFTFLIATPLHDIMVSISSTIILVSMFYITVFIFKSKLHFFKLLCTLYLIEFYAIMFIYGSGYFWDYLPIIQKILFVSSILLILILHYFTKAEDFEHIIHKPKKK